MSFLQRGAKQCSNFRHTFKSSTSILNRSFARLYATTPKHEEVIFSGIQPTGVPHLGNYLGALREWVRLQDEKHNSARIIYSIVDLHALTIRQEAEQLRQWKRETLATLIAIGLDPEKAILFYQSDVCIQTHMLCEKLIATRLRCMQNCSGFLAVQLQWDTSRA
jgi:tryptophanyl-tRNA synthetase